MKKHSQISGFLGKNLFFHSGRQNLTANQQRKPLGSSSWYQNEAKNV